MKNIQNKKIKVLIAILAILTGYTSCKTSNVKGVNSTEKITPVKMVSKLTDEVSVMTFNVENLFDNIHDEGIDDYPYLPLAQKKWPQTVHFCEGMSKGFYKEECFSKNWDDAAIDFKLSQVAKVISYVDEGKGPDNLIMAEVENENILKMLVNKHLSALGYKTIVILKGPDTRGINTAFISKFPLSGDKPQLHVIPYKDQAAHKSRAILEATVKINNKDVTFLAAHFPSQSNPTEWRREAMEHMKNIMLDLEKKGKAVIAGGDLNTIQEEEEDHGYFSKILSQAGDVSHLVGCFQCQGSHSYHGQWSFLDVIVFGKNLPVNAKLSLLTDSIQVVKTPVNTKLNGTPLRFDEIKKEGVSDHFPLYSRLKILK